jgi:hypothetical protein
MRSGAKGRAPGRARRPGAPSGDRPSRSQGCHKACDNGLVNCNERNRELSHFQEIRRRSRLNEDSAGPHLNLLDEPPVSELPRDRSHGRSLPAAGDQACRQSGRRPRGGTRTAGPRLIRALRAQRVRSGPA